MRSSQTSKTQRKRDYERRKRRLKDILSSLDGVSGGYITDKQLQEFGIRVTELDFYSGKTAGSKPAFFMPAAPHVYTVANSGIDPENDAFAQGCRSKRRKVHGDRGWPEDLLLAYQAYDRALAEKYAGSTWQASARRYILADPVKRGRWYPIGGESQRFQTEWSEEIWPEKNSHRQLEMTTDDYGLDCRPFVSELIVLVSWMLGGMRGQPSKTLSKKGASAKRESKFHMIFPVLVISFLKPARARVVQGYFDEGTLNIQISKCYDFNVPNYIDVMNSLLRWGRPIPQGNTTLEKTLPAVSEEAEDEEEEEYSAEGTNSADRNTLLGPGAEGSSSSAGTC
ncbi:hypothetical protein FQN54_006545 [Arachnomyces sp. PD_36]|nr:hypothetical protein FQN54_006545 [Arachnomyces sp. PD_36]